MISVGHERPCRAAGPFALRLRLVRFVFGLTVDELANHLGLSRRTIQKLENGERVPQKGKVREYAAKLGVPEDWLMGEGPVFSWGDVPEDPEEAALPGDDGEEPYLLTRERDPGRILQSVRYSDYELETLMREQKVLKQMASYVEGTVAETEAEQERARETMRKLAKAYAAECERIGRVLDLREQANRMIDSLQDSYDRDVMRRHYLQRQTWSEIEEELGRKDGTKMRVLVHTLTDRLRIQAGTKGDG